MLMAEEYSKFMVFELLDTGERKLLDINEEEFRKNNGENVLDPNQVLIIVKEGLRRIFIWNGFDSSVRKRFIGSRVASGLQSELMEELNFHRCKIVSVDQGDEVKEFLKAFRFSPTKIDKEKRKQKEMGINYKKDFEPPQGEVRNIRTPSLNELKNKNTTPIKANDSESKELVIEKNTIEIPRELDLNSLLENILETDLSSEYERKHILLGENILYGPVTKKIQIFGNLEEEKEWEPIKEAPKRIIELDNHKLRIHLNNEKKVVQAIEVLENTKKPEEAPKEPKRTEKQDKRLKIELDFGRWTLNSLREFCSDHDISIPSGAKKADVVKLAEEYYKSL